MIWSRDKTTVIADNPDKMQPSQRLFLSLDITKATGPDNIPAALLKYCAPYISTSLSNLLNKSSKLGKIPAA